MTADVLKASLLERLKQAAPGERVELGGEDLAKLIALLELYDAKKHVKPACHRCKSTEWKWRGLRDCSVCHTDSKGQRVNS